MTKFFYALLAALGGGAAAGTGYLVYRALKDDTGEPAAPLPAPAPTGGSGIDANDNEVEALARVIASEAGSGTDAEKKAIGWTVRNRFRNKSIYASEFPWRSQKGSNPPFASARPATEASRALARQILAADQSEDPTGGATSFFEPRMQDAFAKAGAMARAGETGDRVIDGVKITDITRFKNYKKDANQIRDSWGKGSTLYANAGRFEMWGSARLFAQRDGVVQTVVGATPYTETDREALARAVESSCPHGTLQEKQAVAWACRNRAARSEKSIVEAIAPGGEYGSRDDERVFCSTAKAPTVESTKVACAVLALPPSADPTEGAVDFWCPKQQAVFHALGYAHEAYADYSMGETAMRERLEQAGFHPCGTVGRFELLRV